MKFFWKIYFSFTVLLLLTFGAFGTFMIQLTFEKSWQRVLAEAERENRMFQLSFEMNLTALDEVYRSDGVIPVTAGSIIQNLSDGGSAFMIYNGDQELLYENRHPGFSSDLLRSSLSDEMPCGYQRLKTEDATYLLFACRSVVGGKSYYLENVRDISEIYQEREAYYDWYTMIMLVLAAVIAVLVFLVTHMLTRSIAALSHAARRFAEGDYEVRAPETGGDEIAELAEDFNNMADTILEKMDELTLQAKKQEDFTASFAHELKTPLTSIIGYADMLRTVECSQEEQFEAVNYIFHHGKRLESLSFKLLELIVSDKQDYSFRPVSMRALVREAVRLTRVRREKKKLRLVTDVPDTLINGEPDLLISVFTNLMDNAGKATDEGGELRIRGRQYQNRCLLCIMDDGCGMEQAEISRITEAFYMVDKSRARKEGGAGLGMTLCSRILRLHNVRWRIFSISKKGTVVAMQFENGEEKRE